MWCQASCLLLLVAVSSCLPQRRYLEWQEEPMNDGRSTWLTPRAYPAAGERNRGYATSDETPRGAVTLPQWYNTPSGRERLTEDERQILQVLMHPEHPRRKHTDTSSRVFEKHLTQRSGPEVDDRTQGGAKKEGAQKRRPEAKKTEGGPDVELRIVTSKEAQRRPSGTVVQLVPKPKRNLTIAAPQFGNRTRGDKRPHSSDIVFPDNSQQPKFAPSRCPKGATFCETEDYPSDYIARVMKAEASNFVDFLGQDVVIEPNVTQRIDLAEESPLCRSREFVTTPKKAQNRDDEFLFIVNQDEFVQAIRVEVCMSEGECLLTEGFPLGYKTSCRQKYIYRKLLCIKEGTPQTDQFKLPSCCSCFVKQDISSRMELLAPKQMTPAVPAPTKKN